MSYRIGICDRDSRYAVGLMEYINIHEGMQLRISVFSSGKAIEEYAVRHRLDLLVIGDEVSVENSNVPRIYITGRRESAEKEDYIYKYQSIEAIAGQMLQRLKAMQPPDVGLGHIYGVYSPLGRCGKTRLAMGLCNYDGNSLYIGLEEYCGYECRDMTIQMNAEKFLYYVSGRNADITSFIDKIHNDKRRFDIIAGGINYMDIRQVTIEDMRWLRELLKKQTKYKRIVFDIGAASLDEINILSVMDKIFIPILKDEISVCKLNSFKRILKEREYKEVEKDLNYVTVPDGAYDSEAISQMIGGVLQK